MRGSHCDHEADADGQQQMLSIRSTAETMTQQPDEFNSWGGGVGGLRANLS